MKKLSFLLMLLSVLAINVSCGFGDDDDDPTWVERVKDGNEKVFLKKGNLVVWNGVKQ